MTSPTFKTLTTETQASTSISNFARRRSLKFKVVRSSTKDSLRNWSKQLPFDLDAFARHWQTDQTILDILARMSPGTNFFGCFFLLLHVFAGWSPAAGCKATADGSSSLRSVSSAFNWNAEGWASGATEGWAGSASSCRKKTIHPDIHGMTSTKIIISSVVESDWELKVKFRESMTSAVGKITATLGGKMLETLMHSFSRAWPDTNFNASTKGQRIEKNPKNLHPKRFFKTKDISSWAKPCWAPITPSTKEWAGLAELAGQSARNLTCQNFKFNPWLWWQRVVTSQREKFSQREALIWTAVAQKD